MSRTRRGRGDSPRASLFRSHTLRIHLPGYIRHRQHEWELEEEGTHPLAHWKESSYSDIRRKGVRYPIRMVLNSHSSLNSGSQCPGYYWRKDGGGLTQDRVEVMDDAIDDDLSLYGCSYTSYQSTAISRRGHPSDRGRRTSLNSHHQ